MCGTSNELTGDMTFHSTTSMAPSFENFRSQNSHSIATRIMKVYWGLDSFRLFPYRNTQSCCVGPETLKNWERLCACLFGTSSFRVILEVLENLVIIYTTGRRAIRTNRERRIK
jgi:hypothetical protein